MLIQQPRTGASSLFTSLNPGQELEQTYNPENLFSLSRETTH